MPKLLYILLALISALSLSATERINSTRAMIQEWVETEKIISNESAAWIEKESTIKDMLSVLRDEVGILEDKIKRGKSGLSAADSKRAELLKEDKELSDSLRALDPFLLSMEKQLLSLKETLPEPLLQKLEPFYLRLPEDAEKTKLGKAERMQTVIGILMELNKFNNTLTLTRELRTLNDGREGEVQTLYVGLASAYYITPGGKDAGIGYPSDSGWEWKSEPGLADKISDAVKVYENAAQEAKFISLPFEVK